MITPFATGLPGIQDLREGSGGSQPAVSAADGTSGKVADPAQGAEATTRPGRPTPRNGRDLEKAATEFESMLLAQILRTAREAGSGGWLDSETGAASSTLELAETQLASALAKRGGVGLAELLSRTMRPDAAGTETPPAVMRTAKP